MIYKKGMHIKVSVKLFNKFKSACALNGAPMSSVIESLIEEYLKRNGK